MVASIFDVPFPSPHAPDTSVEQKAVVAPVPATEDTNKPRPVAKPRIDFFEEPQAAPARKPRSASSVDPAAVQPRSSTKPVTKPRIDFFEEPQVAPARKPAGPTEPVSTAVDKKSHGTTVQLTATPVRRRKTGGFGALARKEDAEEPAAAVAGEIATGEPARKPGLALAESVKDSLEKIRAAAFLVEPTEGVAKAIVDEAVYLLTGSDTRAFEDFCEAVQWRMTALGDAFLDAVLDTLTPIDTACRGSDAADDERSDVALTEDQQSLVASLRHRRPPASLVETYRNTGLSYAHAYHLARSDHHQRLLEDAGIPYWQAGPLALAENPEPVDFFVQDDAADNPFTL